MSEAAPYDAVISLGLNCQCAHQIRRRFDIREAFPLDWVVTSPKAVARIIADGFELKPEASDLSLHKSWVHDERTGVRYVHDFPLNRDFLDVYSDVREKYAFLADRARAVASRRVLFVAHGVPGPDVPMIMRALQNAAVGDWRLLVANPADVPLGELDHPRVVEAVLDGPPPATRRWQGNDQDWDAAFDKGLAIA